MRQLTREVLGADVELDDRRPGASLLKQAIRLRNKLIHHGGFVQVGSALALGARLVEGNVLLTFEDPPFEWREVSIEYAREVVGAVEAFLENVLVEPAVGAVLDDRFFSRRVSRRGGSPRAVRGSLAGS